MVGTSLTDICPRAATEPDHNGGCDCRIKFSVPCSKQQNSTVCSQDH